MKHLKTFEKFNKINEKLLSAEDTKRRKEYFFEQWDKNVKKIQSKGTPEKQLKKLEEYYKKVSRGDWAGEIYDKYCKLLKDDYGVECELKRPTEYHNTDSSFKGSSADFSER
jgi:hypothetical protein